MEKTQGKEKKEREGVQIFKKRRKERKTKRDWRDELVTGQRLNGVFIPARGREMYRDQTYIGGDEGGGGEGENAAENARREMGVEEKKKKGMFRKMRRKGRGKIKRDSRKKRNKGEMERRKKRKNEDDLRKYNV